MFKWSNKSLSFKYGSVYVLTIVLFVISAFSIRFLLTDTKHEVDTMNQSTANSVKLFEMELLIQERYSILGQYIVAPNNNSVSDFENSIAKFNQHLDQLEPYINSDDKQYLLNTALENDAEIIQSFNEYVLLRDAEKSANTNRRMYENARRNYQQSSFSLNQLRTIFEEERLEAVESTSASFHSTTQILFSSILASILIGVFVLIIVNTSVKKRLSNILSYSEQIGLGDLTAEELIIHGNDEFSKIASSLNIMKVRMEEILTDIAGVSTSVGSKSGALEESAVSLEDVSDNVSDKLQELITIVEEQSASIVQISTTNGNFNHRMNSIEKFSLIIKESSTDVATETKEGIRLMSLAVANIDSINKSVENSVDKVNHLVDRAVDISQITGLINKIAEKTNLLALNASIEAARAGQYGRGFAVVAEQIRELSAEVNQSINNINVITEGIQQEADQVKSVLITSNKQTIDEQKKMHQNIVHLKKIEASVEQLANNIENIYHDINVMTDESDEINVSLDVLSNLAKKTTFYINDANESIFKQNNIITRMNAHSKDLYDSASNLESSINQFTVKQEHEATLTDAR